MFKGLGVLYAFHPSDPSDFVSVYVESILVIFMLECVLASVHLLYIPLILCLYRYTVYIHSFATALMR